MVLIVGVAVAVRNRVRVRCQVACHVPIMVDCSLAKLRLASLCASSGRRSSSLLALCAVTLLRIEV